MGGGLMQLVAYGAQDIYLSGNPQITFFKIVYRRHTNFAMECIEQTFNGSGDFGKKVTCSISRNGDLVHRMYLRVKLPTVVVPNNRGFRWLNFLGLILIKSVEIEIGGQRIDRHYGDWMYIWNQLTQSAGKQLGYGNMVGNLPDLVNPKVNTSDLAASAKTITGEVLYIPLEFWFCTNPGLALPLIALQYHEIKCNIEFRELKDCHWAGEYTPYAADPDGAGPGVEVQGSWETLSSAPSSWFSDGASLKEASLYVDYIYLDTDERRRFAQVSHEYLVQQLQFTGDESTSSASYKVKLQFNHPCSELIWVVQSDKLVDDGVAQANRACGKQWFNYSDGIEATYALTVANDANTVTVTPPTNTGLPGVAAGGANGVFLDSYFGGGKNPVVKAKLQLNGHDRVAERDGKYYNVVQPYQHHENVPAVGINVYSFALKPEEHQPSGTCNMSRIDNATLHLELTADSLKTATGATNGSVKIRVYARNYNVLRIMSGMGGLAYSN